MSAARGLDLIDAVLALAAVAETAPHLADAVQAANFGAVRQIAAFGSDRVVEEVLRPILAGRALATIGMSEPGGGTALSHLHTRARREGAEVVLHGGKVFNSNGPHATHFVVWARFGDERHDIGAVVVPAGAPGLERGATERFISGEAHCALSFDGCRVPADHVLLDHDGMRRMMPVFNIERLGNATRSYAYGELALRLATGYMLERETAGGHLADHQALQIFGGYGYTSESQVDYLFKRTRGWMIASGSVEIQRQRIAREVLRRHRPARAQ